MCPGIQTVFWRVFITIIGLPTIAARGTADTYVEPSHQHEGPLPPQVASLLENRCDMLILALDDDLVKGSIAVARAGKGVYSEFVELIPGEFLIKG